MQDSRTATPTPPRPASAVVTSRPTITGRLIAVSLVAFGVLTVGFVALLPGNTATVAPEALPAVNVQVLELTPLPELPDTFNLTAVVEPEAVVRVAAEVAGRIERFGTRPTERSWRGQTLPAGAPIDEGEPVTQGQPLVYLNDDLLQARYDQAHAQFEYDQREFRRILDLSERGSTSQQEVDDARTRRDISQAQYNEAARALERTKIVAPQSGVLNRLPMEIGEYANPGDAVAEIVDLDTVKVVVDVPERDVYYLERGEPAEVLTNHSDARVLHGTITYISELADDLTRTSRVEITLPNLDHALRSGQILRARLTRRVLQNALMVPLDSVIPLEHGRLVYVVESQADADGAITTVAVRREVELGMIKGRMVEVTAGLQAGDTLIVDGQRSVGPGQPVTVVAADAAATADGLTQ